MTGAVYQREYLRRFRYAARIFGCCRDCGKPVDGKRRCERHLAMHAARERRRHARIRAAKDARVEMIQGAEHEERRP